MRNLYVVQSMSESSLYKGNNTQMVQNPNLHEGESEIMINGSQNWHHLIPMLDYYVSTTFIDHG